MLYNKKVQCYSGYVINKSSEKNVVKKFISRGLLKLYWDDISKRVSEVEPQFAAIINEISPDEDFPLYLAYYPYGMYIGDEIGTILPKDDKGYFRLNAEQTPTEMLNDLGYAKKNLPMAMVLDKQVEFFIESKSQCVTIPFQIFKPGDFLSYPTDFKTNDIIYKPNKILSATSGARSVFMLPNIGCATNHANLKKDFNIKSLPAKTLYDHWFVFRELVNCEAINSTWSSCVLFFSENWVTKILNDKAWAPLKIYLSDLAWNKLEYNRNRVYYDIVFSGIQRKRNLKPNPYLADTAKYILAMATGAAPGYIPSTDEESLPTKLLQTVFTQSYGIKKYLPTVMQPTNFKLAEEQTVYYSMQYPALQAFAPKSRRVCSTIYEMRELHHIMSVFMEELKKEDSMCSNTVLSGVAKNTQFEYFHNEDDLHHVIKQTGEIFSLDDRYERILGERFDTANFASDAKFFRGCVSISTS